MKQKQNKILMMVIAFAIICVSSCRKNVEQDSTPRDFSAAAVAPPATMSEDDIGQFIADMIFSQTHPDPPKYLNPAEAIMKMEETMSYRFSDIDTPFLNTTFGDSLDFVMIPNGSGQYNMADIASRMYLMKGFVLNALANRTPANGCHLRVTTCEIEPKGPNLFTLKFVFGNAYDNPPTGFNTATPEVPNGTYYQWGQGFLAEGRCGGQAPYAIQMNGADYLLSLQNRNVVDLTSPYYPPGKRPYYSGIITLKVNNNSMIRYDNLYQASFTGMPTRLPVTLGELTPIRTGIFCGSTGSDVIPYWASIYPPPNPPQSNPFIGYGWCMPYDYINYYISQVKNVFDYVAPAGSVPMTYDEDNVGNNAFAKSGFAVGVTNDAWTPYKSSIYHVYQYHYQQLRYRTDKYYF